MLRYTLHSGLLFTGLILINLPGFLDGQVWRFLSEKQPEKPLPLILVSIPEEQLDTPHGWPWPPETLTRIQSRINQANPMMIVWPLAFSQNKVQSMQAVTSPDVGFYSVGSTSSPEHNLGPLTIPSEHDAFKKPVSICHQASPSLNEQILDAYLIRKSMQACAPLFLRAPSTESTIPHLSYQEFLANSDQIAGKIVVIDPVSKGLPNLSLPYLSSTLSPGRYLAELLTQQIGAERPLKGFKVVYLLVWLIALVSLWCLHRLKIRALVNTGTVSLALLLCTWIIWQADILFFPGTLISFTLACLLASWIPAPSKGQGKPLPQPPAKPTSRPFWLVALEADIEDSRSLKNKAEKLGAASKIMTNLVNRYHGQVESWSGDNIVALWKLDTNQDNWQSSASLAFWCAQAMQAELRKTGITLRVGIATGKAQSGFKGSGKHLVCTYGLPLELANQLQEKSRLQHERLLLCPMTRTLLGQSAEGAGPITA